MEINDCAIAHEIAQQILCKMTEEDINRLAENALRSIKRTDGYGKESLLDRSVKTAYLNAIQGKVEERLNDPEFQQQMAKEAEETVDEILKKSREKMVEEISTRMAALSTGCGEYNLRNILGQFIYEEVGRR